MSLTTADYLFWAAAILFLGAMACFAATLIMHVLMPRQLLNAYFKPPYFKPGEIVAFTGFPLGYIRTVMFMRLVAYPSSGKRRGLTQAYHLAPQWFRQAAKVILILFIGFSVPLAALLLYFFIAYLLSE